MGNYVSSRRLRKNYANKNISFENDEEVKNNNSLGFRMLISSILIVGCFISKEYYYEDLKNNKYFMDIYSKLQEKANFEYVINLINEKD